MKSRLVVVLCLVVLIAGCSSGEGPATRSEIGTEDGVGTDAPTATQTSIVDLPSGVDRGDVTREGDLSESARDGVHRAKNNSEWVLLELSVSRELSDIEYVYSDGSLWTLRVVTGTESYSLHQASESNPEDIVDYSNLSDNQQNFFRTVLNNTPYTLGPDESSVTLPTYVMYENTTYSLSEGTESLDDGALDVDRYTGSD